MQNQSPANWKGRFSLRFAVSAGLLSQFVAPFDGLAQSTNQEPAQLTPVIVTGSMIPTAETVEAVPVETFTAEQFEKIGAQDVVQVLKKMSASFSGNGTTTRGGFTEYRVAVRNLPTLVLLNGRRLANSSFSNGAAVDLRTIPITMIERIEVLKDGASSIYGSDAIGGVVNIITKKNFNGVEISGRYGFSTDPGRVSEYRASVLGGLSTDKARFVLGATYYRMDPLLEKDRHVSSAGVLDLLSAGLAPHALISPLFPGRVQDGSFKDASGVTHPLTSYILAGSPLAFGAPGYNPAIQTPPVGGGPFPRFEDYLKAHPGVYLPISTTPLGRALDATGVIAPNAYPLLNTTEFGTTESPYDQEDRRNVFANLEYDLLEKKVQLFGDFLYANNQNQRVQAPTPNSFLALSRITIPKDNPYNPLGIDLGQNGTGDPRIWTRFNDVGNRILDPVTDYYRFVSGLKGALDQKYLNSYEIGYTYNRSEQLQKQKNGINGAALNLALQPDFKADPSGKLSKLTDASGRPLPTYNYFALPESGLNSPATLDALRAILHRSGVSEEYGVDARINGDSLELPAGPLSYAVGGDFRTESLKIDFDGLSTSGLAVGGATQLPFAGGKRDQWAVFGEARIPLTSPTWNAPGLHNFEINVSGRYEQVEPGGDSAVPKIALRWQPLDEQVTLRGGYSQGFLAPTLFTLYGPDRVEGPSLAVGGAAGQVRIVRRSNPDISPATSQNWNAGLVYSPKQIKGLTLSVDYYNIDEQDIPVQDPILVANSLNALGSASPFASGFAFADGTRLTTPAPNQVTVANWGSAVVPTTPGAAQRTDGLDLGLTYARPTESFGRFTLDANANVLFNYTFRARPGAPYYQFAGLSTDIIAGAQGTLPDYFITTRLTWEIKDLTYTVGARYIPEVLDLGNLHPSVGSTAHGGTLDRKAWEVSDYHLIDMQLAYEFGKSRKSSKWLDGTRLAVGVNNVTDNLAPFIASNFEHEDKTTYDVLGRFVYFELSKKF